MNKTKIEWVKNPDGTPGYTWNPITGCLGGCPYCYARKMAHRFGDDFTPKFHPERLKEPLKLKKSSTIFVGSMTDMFGDWVERWVWAEIFIKYSFSHYNNLGHIYLVLTKYPQNIEDKILMGVGVFEKFPKLFDNFWFGVTITGPTDLWRIDELRRAWPGPKFISLEPYLEVIPHLNLQDINWLIIGAQTNPTVKPPAFPIFTNDYTTKYFFKNSMAKHGYKLEDNQNIPWVK